MELLDVVVLTKDLPDSNLRKGQIGTVVEVYESDDLEVEFVDLQGKTYALETLNASELMQIHYSPLPQIA
ncbi:MAG: DUF4926 domain-containing protein [Phormidesmis sp.]